MKLCTRVLLSTAAVALLSAGAISAKQESAGGAPAAGPSLDEMRLTMGKWIETEQILSKERKEWQQGREILLGRLELVKQEIAQLEEKLAQSQGAVDEAARKRDLLLAENEELKAAGAKLAEAVGGAEGEVRRLLPVAPEETRGKLQKIEQRMPQDPASTRVSVAERYQNVLAVMNELAKVHSEITVAYEVHDLAGGRPTEVKTIYVGLAQAYYVSAKGEAGVGRPGPDGWTWEPANELADEVLHALEILQGKQSPAFVPLPVKLR